jgi:hypothetical protein
MLFSFWFQSVEWKRQTEDFVTEVNENENLDKELQ